MFAVQALPLIIIFLQFCLATAPPSLELPGRVQRVQVGLGLGAGGRGRQSWDWGVRECLAGFLTIHLSLLALLGGNRQYTFRMVHKCVCV